jgi:hypothetical protein
VTVGELESAVLLALRGISERASLDGKLAPKEDLYWRVPDSSLYSVYEKPTEFEIGNLGDDADTIVRVIEEGFASTADLQAICAWLTWLSIEADKRG